MPGISIHALAGCDANPSQCRKALGIADWVVTQKGLAREPDERALFTALQTCARKAERSAEGGADRAGEEWVRRWQAIRAYLAEKNLGLAYLVIRRLNMRTLDETDQVSDAVYALLRAIDRFNPWKGHRFSTYACHVIARFLMRHCRKQLRYRRLFPISYDSAIERPSRPPDWQHDLHLETLQRVLEDNLAGLTPLESTILSQRFPAGERSRLTFQQIGDVVGLSKERVRQVHNDSLDKLRSALNRDAVLHRS